ncbi:TPA: response regulator [Vibrio cholerae]|nr:MULTISPECIES: response regulator [Vibrio]AEA78472.1 Chemotaxis regulator - transmits chemoreceptor signals to flagelllar motor components CheY [Vibrio cholerae LMA3984-4]EEY47778.1 chemotaxis regulator CheY [Vibrio cholerae INDRE 91/1]EEY52288.1 chemotaxis regulator CheY [Vibrio cholerae CT 5369-93]ELV8624852.1 response regulator [Vibrio cidicii]EYC48234.1 chemotaxis protein CheY [Vibrio cholerae O1 biovar El Tor str. L-3226]MDG6205496.1 response regulator [Vibrio sp. NO3-D2]
MKKVMVVDDASTVRMYHKALLEEIGIFILEASNGVEALERALEMPVDLFLVDINMPKMDGFTLVREIRCRPELAGIPTVMISTESQESDRQQGIHMGANLYMVKPVNPEELQQTVTLMLGGLK